MTSDGLADRERFQKALAAELPHFIARLLAWEIPHELRNERFGIKNYHHPELLEAIDALAPETRLLSLIDRVYFPDGSLCTDTKTLTAEEIEAQLVSSDFGYGAKQLLSWSCATGTYLGRLAVQHPERVQRRRTGHKRYWILRPPAVTP